MFYYLLDKSSFLKKLDTNKKNTSILIYGTIIYIVFHFILSNLKNKNLIKYFWVIFVMDIIAVAINTNITSELIFNKNIKVNSKNIEEGEQNIKTNDISIDENQEEVKSILKKKNLKGNKSKKVHFEEDNKYKNNSDNKDMGEIIEITESDLEIVGKSLDQNSEVENNIIPQTNKKSKKDMKKRKSTPISEIIKNKPENNKHSTEEEISLVLADIQSEASDGGSDIDLDSFEKNYFDN
tara:strand:- start:2548 stop:3261 length:714 start_codon:yes stop_codon:yes gene_type:complete